MASDLQLRARQLAASLDEIIAFADAKRDYVLAAKLVDLQFTLIERHVSDGSILPD